MLFNMQTLKLHQSTHSCKIDQRKNFCKNKYIKWKHIMQANKIERENAGLKKAEYK